MSDPAFKRRRRRYARRAWWFRTRNRLPQPIRIIVEFGEKILHDAALVHWVAFVVVSLGLVVVAVTKGAALLLAVVAVPAAVFVAWAIGWVIAYRLWWTSTPPPHGGSAGGIREPRHPSPDSGTATAAVRPTHAQHERHPEDR